MRGVDSFATIRPAWAPQLKAIGYDFAARYYRRAPLTGGRGNAVSKEEVAALHENGLAFLPVYQNTSNFPGYFNLENATHDAAAAVVKARDMGQPASTIFFAVDCDIADMNPVIMYFDLLAHDFALTPWNLGVYGPGAVCAALKDEGLVDFTWLSNAKGWRGYKDWLPHADVVQTTLPFTLPFGLEVDGNECRNPRCLWRPAKPVPEAVSWFRRIVGWF